MHTLYTPRESTGERTQGRTASRARASESRSQSGDSTRPGGVPGNRRVCQTRTRERSAPAQQWSAARDRLAVWALRMSGCSPVHEAQVISGHYHRSLETGRGHLSDLRIPMLECQQCQHDAITQFVILEKYTRFWMDLDQDVLFCSGFSESLRHIRERWSVTVGAVWGCAPESVRINQLEPLATCAHTGPRSPVSPQSSNWMASG
jgi:hypothetical protein